MLKATCEDIVATGCISVSVNEVGRVAVGCSAVLGSSVTPVPESVPRGIMWLTVCKTDLADTEEESMVNWLLIVMVVGAMAD